jgi:hypothetical protein
MNWQPQRAERISSGDGLSRADQLDGSIPEIIP